MGFLEGEIGPEHLSITLKPEYQNITKPLFMNNHLERYHQLLKAIDAERKHDETFYKNLNANKGLKEKVDEGFAWYPVSIIRKSYSIGEHIEIEIERSSSEAKSHKFSEGVAVSVFNVQDDRSDFRGVISGLRQDTMRIMMHQDVMEKLDVFDHGLSGVELIYDDRPYKVMEKAIMEVISSKKDNIQAIREALFYQAFRNEITPDPAFVVPVSGTLNPSQMAAIGTSLQAPYLSIIHGPPGTGKTTTLVALTENLLKNEKQILVCASSNNAVDLLARRLWSRGITVLRVGHVTRIHEDLLHLTMDEQVRHHPDWVHIKKVKIQAEELFRKSSQYKRKWGPEERDERRDQRKEARQLRQWAFELEERLTDEIKNNTRVIATTLIGVSHKWLEGMHFSTVVIDEASQALEPECWNAILKADRVVLAGDHKQLPPTVKSQESVRLGLDVTLLDILAGQTLYSSVLKIQYRMNEAILTFSNQKFYHGLLESDPSVRKRVIHDDRYPLVFIDTAGCGFEEMMHSERKSFFNQGEFFIIREHILLHYEKWLGAQIGIICPYAEQVRYIRQEMSGDASLSQLDIEVNTIDGFQGQEKEVIYISLVRSNLYGGIGFVEDGRRLNVAMTRAQKKLVIVGDSSTLGQHNLYSDLLTFIENEGHYDSAWNYMGY